MPSNSTEQIKYLDDKICEYVSLYNSKRQANKYFAFFLKLFSALLAALITVLLGITYEGKNENVYKNIALILGALITIINTWDAFFNHKALWVRFTIAMVNLIALKNRIHYLAVKPPDQIKDDELDKMHEDLQKIILDCNSNWLELKKDETKSGG